MCKIDLQKCYWSISLPKSWCRVFVVEVNGVRYKYTRLPFGWHHSPAICQTLVRALVRSALSRVGKAVGWQVYLDDVLLDAKRRHTLIKGGQAVVRKLRPEGFIISTKSELTPSKRLVFVGKFLVSVRKTMQNQPAVLVGAFRMWLCGMGTGLMCAVDLVRFLGRLQCLSKPTALPCFLARAYQAAYKGKGRFTRALIHATATALLFCTAPQSYTFRPPHSAPTFFADAAPPL